MRVWMIAVAMCLTTLRVQAQGVPLIDTHSHF